LANIIAYAIRLRSDVKPSRQISADKKIKKSAVGSSIMKIVTKTVSGATALSAAIGLAMAMQAAPTSADGIQDQMPDHPQQLAQMQMPGDQQPMQQMQKQMHDDPQVMAQMQKFIKNRMQKEHLEMCYGINAAAKNDCGTAAHSCHGQATQARDPGSFVLVPTGACTKIDGGRLNPA
jgi:uncharacterized membrane protein